MFRLAIIFFVVGLVAMLFGFYNIAGVSVEVGKIVLVAFLILSTLSFIASWASHRRTLH
ncbi:MAG TPA: DUF1328 domain-containing protein [Bdellovibrionota bacterium]|jgi:uncharacterized membrane protein YtjA (UPF0391 family)|nr:DUF1328 domain-containing protein [Bdellovibrionota bacterium]